MQRYRNCFENYTASQRFWHSVITNFVIPKCDKKTNKKNHTFSSTAGARPTIPTIFGMMTEEVIFAPPNFFAPISSFAARGYWKFVGKCPHHRKMLITSLFLPRDQTKNLKIVQTSRPWGKNLWTKFKNFRQFWGLYSYTSAPINVKFGNPVPKFTFIGATCHPCRAKNPFSDHWVKTILAWLHFVQACR